MHKLYNFSLWLWWCDVNTVDITFLRVSRHALFLKDVQNSSLKNQQNCLQKQSCELVFVKLSSVWTWSRNNEFKGDLLMSFCWSYLYPSVVRKWWVSFSEWPNGCSPSSLTNVIRAALCFCACIPLWDTERRASIGISAGHWYYCLQSDCLFARTFLCLFLCTFIYPTKSEFDEVVVGTDLILEPRLLEIERRRFHILGEDVGHSMVRSAGYFGMVVMRTMLLITRRMIRVTVHSTCAIINGVFCLSSLCWRFVCDFWTQSVYELSSWLRPPDSILNACVQFVL